MGSKLILGILLILLSSLAQAKTYIIYLNGINNSEQDAADSSLVLGGLMSDGWARAGMLAGSIEVTYWHSPNDGFLGDVFEVTAYAKASHEALASARTINAAATADGPEYKAALGQYFSSSINALQCDTIPTCQLANQRILSDAERRNARVVARFTTRLSVLVRAGHKVVVVSHSQGNEYADAVDAYMHFSGSLSSAEISSSIRYVGVAVAAPATPNGRYVTSNTDTVISLYKGKIATPDDYTNASPLEPNAFPCMDLLTFTSCYASVLGLTGSHGFSDFYLNANYFVDPAKSQTVQAQVLSLVQTSFNELNGALTPLPPGTWSISCKGKSTVLGPWTTFGTASWDSSTNAYSVGDSVVNDPNDLDGDCNQVDSWNPNGLTNQDNDWLIYNQVALADIDFSAEACITHSPASGHFIGLFKADPAFTNLSRSGHSPIGDSLASFFTMWNQPGKLMYSIGGSGGVVGEVPSVPLISKGFCANYQITRSGGLYSLYVNGSLVRSASASIAPVYPTVMAYDNVVTLTPKVTLGKVTTFSVDAVNEAGTTVPWPSNSTAATCKFTAAGVWGETSFVGNQIGAEGIDLRGAGTLVPAANAYSLVVKYRNRWILAGSSWTAILLPGESVTFAINDTPGSFYNNIGALTVNASCAS
ncbi:hypothetical protein PFX98_04725 [Paucibacter sediminis]|uniref:Uncharacterized protein n=1 Tax=Paucibacter sediminis TaxID=3019553 RepID=A0AA95NKX2_9BURK|nr:hypothetical protein [Paucibacter sp. S2-9]WIT12916.1 hypothetical protein PFX98_04725 [Paucibacter sp. S2-9]